MPKTTEMLRALFDNPDVDEYAIPLSTDAQGNAICILQMKKPRSLSQASIEKLIAAFPETAILLRPSKK